MRSHVPVSIVLSSLATASLTAAVSAGAPAAADARIAIPLSPTDAAALRAEMRGQLITVQGLVSALAADDWDTVAGFRGRSALDEGNRLFGVRSG